jgi:hypothetical protein
MRSTYRALAVLTVATAFSAGCSGPPDRTGIATSGDAHRSRADGSQVRNVVCLFDQRPWINADAAADRDPEGVQYRVFLDVGQKKGKFQEGTFHIELYELGRTPDGRPTRTLASDWHYPTSAFVPVKAAVLGEGYRLQLYWARKTLAGNEIELITKFEDPAGRISRSDTKRLRIPKYSS